MCSRAVNNDSRGRGLKTVDLEFRVFRCEIFRYIKFESYKLNFLEIYSVSEYEVINECYIK